MKLPFFNLITNENLSEKTSQDRVIVQNWFLELSETGIQRSHEPYIYKYLFQILAQGNQI